MAAGGAYRKATTGLVSSMLSFEEEEDLAWAKGAPRSGEDWDRPFAGLRNAARTAPGPTGTRADSRQQASRGVVRLVQPDLRRHALLGRSVALLAAQEKWQAETHQDGRALALGLRQAARESASGHPPLQAPAYAPACTSGAPACRAPVRASVTGVAPLSPWWPTARLSRWWRPTWILSTCSATPSGRVPPGSPRALSGTLDRVAAPSWVCHLSPHWCYFHQPTIHQPRR